MATKTKEKRDEVLAEVGFTPAIVAASASRVFGLVVNSPMRPDGAGWDAVARFAESMFSGGMNDASEYTFAAFAEMLRKAFARAEAPSKELAPFEALKPPVRAAWEAVARHLSNVFNFERDEAGRLEGHERRMAKYALAGFRGPA